MSTLLALAQEKKRQARELLRIETRAKLREALAKLPASQPLIVFGSLTKPYQFYPGSDVDVALFHEPSGISLYGFQSRLEELMHRRVDVVLLPESRIREKIEREGERWTI